MSHRGSIAHRLSTLAATLQLEAAVLDAPATEASSQNLRRVVDAIRALVEEMDSSEE